MNSESYQLSILKFLVEINNKVLINCSSSYVGLSSIIVKLLNESL